MGMQDDQVTVLLVTRPPRPPGHVTLPGCGGFKFDSAVSMARVQVSGTRPDEQLHISVINTNDDFMSIFRTITTPTTNQRRPGWSIKSSVPTKGSQSVCFTHFPIHQTLPIME